MSGAAANGRYDARVRPLAALRAFRALLADKEDNAQVFAIMRALNGRSTARGYRQLIRTQRGGAIAYRREELAERLADAGWLAQFGGATVGAAYRAFTGREGLSNADLVASSRAPRGFMIDLEHPFAWYGRRIRDSHDIWHVLTGYGREPLGELCLTAFSWRQTGQLGWAFITLAGAFEIVRRGHGWAALAAIAEGFRLGGRADWLPGQDVAALMAEPLDDARRRLRLPSPRRYLAIDPAARVRVLARTGPPSGTASRVATMTNSIQTMSL